MKIYRRNYCSDAISAYITIYQTLDKVFNKYQTSENEEVPYNIIMSEVMKATKGSVSPIMVEEIIKEFQV